MASRGTFRPSSSPASSFCGTESCTVASYRLEWAAVVLYTSAGGSLHLG